MVLGTGFKLRPTIGTKNALAKGHGLDIKGLGAFGAQDAYQVRVVFHNVSIANQACGAPTERRPPNAFPMPIASGLST